MLSPRTIKKRIRSTRNIKQITKAIEAVSAVKMRKSEEAALRGRPYALAALEVLRNISSNLENGFEKISLLLSSPEGKPPCLLVISSDKGLAGSFNINVLRKAMDFLKENPAAEIIAVGKKGSEFLKRRGVNVIASFSEAGDFVELSETTPIANLIRENFEKDRWSSVTLLYTHFISALNQEVISRPILPFNFESLDYIVKSITPLRGKYANMPVAIGSSPILPSAYVFEPSPQQALSKLLPTLLEVEVYHAVLEANASEHSSRMLAMKNASENAGELIDSLTLEYNKARQAQITKELTEITAGAGALEN